MTSDQLRSSPAQGRRHTETRELVDQLRQMAVHQETASLLDRRADTSDSPGLAATLHGRAAERRRRAERIRLDLSAQGVALERRHQDR